MAVTTSCTTVHSAAKGKHWARKIYRFIYMIYTWSHLKSVFGIKSLHIFYLVKYLKYINKEARNY